MRVLNNNETNEISGGYIAETISIVLGATALGISIYNYVKINDIEDFQDTLFIFTLYQELQLTTLPGYYYVNSLYPYEVYDALYGDK